MTDTIKPYWFCALFWIFCSVQALGQSKSDSLFNALKQAPDGQDSVAVIIKLAYEQIETKQAISLLERAYMISLSLDEEKQMAKCLQQLGWWQAYDNQFETARLSIRKSLDLFQTLELEREISRSIFYLGVSFEWEHEYDSAKRYYLDAIALSESINDVPAAARYHLFLGGMENQRGDNKTALEHVEIANKYFDSPARGDSAWISLNSMGIIYDEMGMYPEALEFYLKAYNILENGADDQEGKITLANNLGLIYHELGKLEEANDYYSSALESARINGFTQDEAMLLNNLSILYSEEGDSLKALKVLRRAHQLQLNSDQPCDLAYSFEGLGESMVWLKQYDSANYYYNQALDWATKCEMMGSQTSIHRNVGILYYKQGKKRESEKHLLKSLELGKASGYGLEMKETTKELFNFYQQNNDLNNALKYQLMHSNIKDSLFNVQSTERIARMTAEYDFRREIESLEYKKMADEMRLNEELRQKEAYQNSILVVLVLTLLLAATLGRSYYLVQNHNKKLTALNEEKNTLMGVVAHDLRSPLNNIKGLLSLLKMDTSSTSPEQKHYFRLVDDTMERMRDMIDRVLDVSVVEDMKVNLNMKKVDLGKTVNFVAENFEPLAQKKSIDIRFDLDQEKHFILADYNYLLQVIENLLSNAIKFSEAGKSIYLEVHKEEGKEIIVVRDEGPGISEEDQTRLFTKFQKLSAKPTNNEQSTGLGLSIVKKFVDAMNAEITCESELGKGTSFIVRFKTAVEHELV